MLLFITHAFCLFRLSRLSRLFRLPLTRFIVSLFALSVSVAVSLSASADENTQKMGAQTTGQGALQAASDKADKAASPSISISISEKGIAERVKACIQCHGKQGEGSRAGYFPRLAGKPTEYLFNQLKHFREGHRKYAPMNYLVTYLSDDYLHQMAHYFSHQTPPYPPPEQPTTPASLLKRGRTLALTGDPAKDIPACVTCHGARLTGRQPAIPGLIGLQSDYISAQLGAWRNGTRYAIAPDCMQTIAARLDESDIRAVAAWLSTQPVSPNDKPAPATKLAELPMACGSQTQTQTYSNLAQQKKKEEKEREREKEKQLEANLKIKTKIISEPDLTDVIQRGKYLADAGDCIACHTVRGGKPFAGGLPMPTPFGTLYTPNITPDPKTGIGQWTADDFYRAMHTGHSKEGSLLYPAFPFTSYTKVTRADVDAIYAYLRSIPPVVQPNQPNALYFPFNHRELLIGWRLLFFSEREFKPDSHQSAEWNRGAYLVEGLGHCAMCHTSINALGAPNQRSAFEGGLIPLQNWYAPSITSNKAAGLGDWSIEQISDLLKTGVSDRGAVFGPMAEVVHNSLQHLSDNDIRAISVYLKALPQKKAPPEPLQFEVPEELGIKLLAQGQKIYTKMCAECHKDNGLGQPGIYPALTDNQSIQMPSAANMIRMVLNGGYPPSTAGNPHPYGMPPFAQHLSDEEVAAVVTYIRSAWGNHRSPVSPQQVNELRSAPLD